MNGSDTFTTHVGCVWMRMCSGSLPPLLDFTWPHCIMFAWTQQWSYSCWNREDEFGRISGPTAELSLYNPWFFFFYLFSHGKLDHTTNISFSGVLMFSQTNNPAKYVCARTNWIGFLDWGVYATYWMHSMYSKVNLYRVKELLHLIGSCYHHEMPI